MLKKSIMSFASILIVTLFSCTNTHSPLSPVIEDDTLRSRIQTNQDSIVWTDEIDGFILYEDASAETADNESSPVSSGNPEFDKILQQAEQVRQEMQQQDKLQEANVKKGLLTNKKSSNLYMYSSYSDDVIFPSITDFASLDTRAITDSTRKILDGFFLALKGGKISKNLFSPKRSYISSVLEYQFMSYPVPESWIYGKPFLRENETESIYEIPVRVIAKKSYYDMWVYISSSGTGEFIDQVQLGSIVIE